MFMFEFHCFKPRWQEFGLYYKYLLIKLSWNQIIKIISMIYNTVLMNLSFYELKIYGKTNIWFHLKETDKLISMFY